MRAFVRKLFRLSLGFSCAVPLAGTSLAAGHHIVYGSVNDDSIDYQLNKAHSGSIALSTPFPTPLKLLWSKSLKAGHGFGGTPVIAGGMIYIGTVSQSGVDWYYAMNLADGKLVWQKKYRINETAYNYDNGRLFTLDDKDNMAAYTAGNDKQKWFTRLKKQPYSEMGPLAANGTVIAIGTGKAHNGFLFNTMFGVNEVTGHINWQFQHTADDYGSFAFGDNAMFFDAPCNYYKYDPATGHEVWHDSTGCHGAGTAVPVYYNKRLFIQGVELFDNVLILDSDTGATLGSHHVTFPISPAIYTDSDGKDRVASLYNNVLTSWDVATGETKWSFQDLSFESPPIVVNGLVIAGSQASTVYVLDGDSGTLLQTLQVTLNCEAGGCLPPYLAAGDGVLLVNFGNEMFAYAPQ